MAHGRVVSGNAHVLVTMAVAVLVCSSVLEGGGPPTALGERDGGGATHGQAVAHSTNPLSQEDAAVDSDHDGLPDAWEAANGLDPHDASGDSGPDGDLDGDGDRNIYEFWIGTQANDAGSCMNHDGSARVLLHYTVSFDSTGRAVRTVGVHPAAGVGGGDLVIAEGADSIDIPTPFWHVDDPCVYAEFSAHVSGRVTQGLTAPLGAPMAICTFKSQDCTLLGSPASWEMRQGRVNEDLSVELDVVARAAIKGLPQQVNRDRAIPLAVDRLPSPAEFTLALWTEGGPTEVAMKKTSESEQQLREIFTLAPLGTDLDVSITGEGLETAGKSKTQHAPSYFLDCQPGTVITVRAWMPGFPEGYQATPARRTWCVKWPLGCFTVRDGEGTVSDDRASGYTFCALKGTEEQTSMTWHLWRTDAPLPQGRGIEASVTGTGLVIPVVFKAPER